MTKVKVEGKISTGIGEGYLQIVKTKDTSETGLTYEDKVYEVFSIDPIFPGNYSIQKQPQI